MLKKYDFRARHWITIALCFCMAFLANAVTSDSENVILPKLAEANNWDYYGKVLTIATIAGCVSIVGNFIFGKICEKKGPKFVILLGLCSSIVFMLLYGLSTSYVVLAIGLIGVICSGQCVSFIGATALVANWFPKKKGLAMGFVSIGPPAASVVMVVAINWIINTFGVKGGVFTICGVLAVVTILSVLFMHDTPEMVGETPDNLPVEASEAINEEDSVLNKVTTRELMKVKEFWLITAIIGICSLVQTGLMAQWMVRYTGSDFPETQAALFMTICAVVGIFGSMIVGFFENKLGTKKSYMVLAIWFAVAMILNVTNVIPLIYISVVMFGFCVTLLQIYMPAFEISAFGRTGFRQANAFIFPVISFCGQLSFIVIAVFAKIFGEMRYVYVLFAILLIISAVLAGIMNLDKAENN